MLSLEFFVTTIKPACEKFLRLPTEKNLSILRNDLAKLESSQLNAFQSYILFPLVVKIEDLKDGQYSDVKFHLINCIRDILLKIRLKDVNALKTIIMAILKQIYNFEADSLKDNLSEELKLAVIECISSAFDRATQDTLENFYIKDHSPIISKVALTCVQIISQEKYRKLRISSIQCLMALFYVHDSADFYDIVLRNQVADITFVFLPKIAQTLVQISNGEKILGQDLLSIGVQALSRILCLIFQDYEKTDSELSFTSADFAKLIKTSTGNNKSDDEILGITLSKVKSMEERFKQLKEKTRTIEWLGASSRKLKPILSSLLILRANPQHKIRKEYAIMCCTLAEKCFKNLKDSFSTFLQAIIALSQDEDEDIRKLCNDCIFKLQHSSAEFIFNETVIDLFEKCLIRLPRIINRCEDAEQESEFRFLKGYIHILPKDNLNTIFRSSGNIERFCMCLISAFELQLHRDLLVEEFALREISRDNEINELSFPWRRYKNLNSPVSVKLLQDVCSVLGNSTVMEILFDHLMNILTKNIHMSNEILLILIFLMSNDSKETENLKNDLIYKLLEEILQNNHWHLALQPDPSPRIKVDKPSHWFEDRTPGLYESAVEIRIREIDSDEDDEEMPSEYVTVNDAEFNVLHTCILLDSIGHLSLVLKEKFRPFTFKSLHKIIHKTGSSNYMVHLSGNFALNCVKTALNFHSISDLIHHNSDYITYHINVGLQKVEQSQIAVDIFAVVLQNSSIRSYPYLEHILTTLLNESSKITQANNLISYLKVFHIFLTNVRSWDNNIHKEIEENSPEYSNIAVDIQKNWLEILNKVEDIDASAEIESENEETNNIEQKDTDEPESPSKEIVIPSYIKMSIDIIKIALKLISNKNQTLKIVSLECLIIGIPLLINYENELLPIVHLIWEPFAQQFRDKDPIVLSRCLILLEVLAVHAKDFILSRTLKDIVPFLTDFLLQSAKNSEADINLTETQQFKLQKKLLLEYPNLINSMEIQERELYKIYDSIWIYLSQRQPKCLQQAARDFFLQMFSYNGPLVYVKLLFLATIDEFSENVKLIFKCKDIAI